uniref:DDE Tnp4 domain-containing protein n=1 Tax=Rhabditophanes sp. KR3021 TaxID=114890 RepID=A0AC35UAR4_9BILA
MVFTANQCQAMKTFGGIAPQVQKHDFEAPYVDPFRIVGVDNKGHIHLCDKAKKQQTPLESSNNPIKGKAYFGGDFHTSLDTINGTASLPNLKPITILSFKNISTPLVSQQSLSLPDASADKQKLFLSKMQNKLKGTRKMMFTNFKNPIFTRIDAANKMKPILEMQSTSLDSCTPQVIGAFVSKFQEFNLYRSSFRLNDHFQSIEDAVQATIPDQKIMLKDKLRMFEFPSHFKKFGCIPELRSCRRHRKVRQEEASNLIL